MKCEMAAECREYPMVYVGGQIMMCPTHYGEYMRESSGVRSYMEHPDYDDWEAKVGMFMDRQVKPFEWQILHPLWMLDYNPSRAALHFRKILDGPRSWEEY